MSYWENQYQEPTIEGLVSEIPSDYVQMFESLRELVASKCSKKPTLEWSGLSMKWCEVYQFSQAEMIKTIHLIPSTEIPRIHFLLSTAFFEKHSPQTLPKNLHAFLELAVTIGHQTWCDMTILNQSIMQSVEQFIEIAFD